MIELISAFVVWVSSVMGVTFDEALGAIGIFIGIAMLAVSCGVSEWLDGRRSEEDEQW